jgi:hypothetical protein
MNFVSVWSYLYWGKSLGELDTRLFVCFLIERSYNWILAHDAPFLNTLFIWTQNHEFSYQRQFLIRKCHCLYPSLTIKKMKEKHWNKKETRFYQSCQSSYYCSQRIMVLLKIWSSFIKHSVRSSLCKINNFYSTTQNIVLIKILYFTLLSGFFRNPKQDLYIETFTIIMPDPKLFSLI